MRFKTPEAMEDVKARLATVVEKVSIKGPWAHITPQRYFLPLVRSEASRQLFDVNVD